MIINNNKNNENKKNKNNNSNNNNNNNNNNVTVNGTLTLCLFGAQSGSQKSRDQLLNGINTLPTAISQTFLYIYSEKKKKKKNQEPVSKIP